MITQLPTVKRHIIASVHQQISKNANSRLYDIMSKFHIYIDVSKLSDWVKKSTFRSRAVKAGWLLFIWAYLTRNLQLYLDQCLCVHTNIPSLELYSDILSNAVYPRPEVQAIVSTKDGCCTIRWIDALERKEHFARIWAILTAGPLE